MGAPSNPSMRASASASQSAFAADQPASTFSSRVASVETNMGKAKPITSRITTDPASLEMRTATPMLPCVSALSLFGRHREILIEHAGVHYRLRITRANKLILTK